MAAGRVHPGGAKAIGRGGGSAGPRAAQLHPPADALPRLSQHDYCQPRRCESRARRGHVQVIPVCPSVPPRPARRENSSVFEEGQLQLANVLHSSWRRRRLAHPLRWTSRTETLYSSCDTNARPSSPKVDAAIKSALPSSSPKAVPTVACLLWPACLAYQLRRSCLKRQSHSIACTHVDVHRPVALACLICPPLGPLASLSCSIPRLTGPFRCSSAAHLHCADPTAQVLDSGVTRMLVHRLVRVFLNICYGYYPR